MSSRHLIRAENQDSSSTGNRTLLYLALLILFLVLILLFAAYWRVSVYGQETQLCTAFRTMDQCAKNQLGDLLYVLSPKT